MNNIRNITLALLNYADTHKAFPPAYTVDANGNRLHSWRTLLLPYLDQQSLYESIDFSKPWNRSRQCEGIQHAARSLFLLVSKAATGFHHLSWECHD